MRSLAGKRSWRRTREVCLLRLAVRPWPHFFLEQALLKTPWKERHQVTFYSPNDIYNVEHRGKPNTSKAAGQCQCFCSSASPFAKGTFRADVFSAQQDYGRAHHCCADGCADPLAVSFCTSPPARAGHKVLLFTKCI